MLDQLKINNLTNILTCIFTRKTATKAELVQCTELSNSTVSASVNSLLKLELLLCDGMEESIGGRRSRIYRLNKSYGCFIGVDMTPERLSICVTDCENERIESFCCPIQDGKPVIDQLIGALDALVERHGKVLGIGIGLSAEINYGEQVVVDCPDFGWRHVHLKEILERHFTAFACIDHRINGVALRESLLGQATGVQNYLCVYESAMEKAALILDGDLCRGFHNHVGALNEVSLFPLLEQGLLSFLNISLVVVGYCTEEYKNKVEQLARAHAASAICVPEADHSLAAGMAAVTQQRWFKSIYFML